MNFNVARGRRRLVAAASLGAVTLGGLAALPASPAQAAVACSVQYQYSEWQGGMSVNVIIRNTGDAWSSWTLGFGFANANQKVTQGWSANWSQSGQNVSASSLSWNGTVPNGGTANIGFNGTWSGSNPAPTNFVVNGVSCGGTGPTTTTTTRPPTTTTTTTTRPPTTTTTTTTRPPTTTTTTTTRPPTTTTTTTTTTTSQSVSGLYVDPTTAGAKWADANGGDSRASVIRSRIVVQPQASWITEGTNASASAQKASSYIAAARAAGKIPQIVLYALPNRDCGGASAGGASDLNAYASWVSTVANVLGNGIVYVMLEPDSLALQTCLSSSEATARGNAISAAITTIKNANPNAKVYLDAGHSAWNSPSVTASRLSQAGVSKSNGFYSNVSNYQTTSAEVSFGQQVLAALGNPSNLKQVVDTSRNGAGPGSGDWCDDNLPSSRRLGTTPTLSTGTSSVEAFLWIKLPGEADGCAKTPGTFYPENAYSLTGGIGGTTTTTTTTTRPTTTTTTRPTTTTTTRPITTTTTSSGPVTTEPHQDNPYVGAVGYVNPEWKAKAESVSGGSRVSNNSTAVWIDRIAAIEGTENSQSNGAMGLADHLDAALAQQNASGKRVTAQFMIYDLPGRDCSALASNGELGPTEIGRYKTEYIDAIAAIMSNSKYASLRIVTIIEPDSLPNLLTNTNIADCQEMISNGNYIAGVTYALNKLHAIPNVYTYVDAAHHGWLGWDDNMAKAVAQFTSLARGTTAGFASIDGFIVNTANTSATVEPYFKVTDSINGTSVRQSKWVDWNSYVDEQSYAQGMRAKLVTAGFPSSLGFLIDTSRNGWGGPLRPTGTSTSTDVNTYVNGSRIDRRLHAGNWCNQVGAGLGERPTAAPASGIDAYVWAKPPAESDGSSSLIVNSDNKGFDRMCDPTYTGNSLNGNNLTGAMANAPISGAWFPAQFAALMANAYPPL